MPYLRFISDVHGLYDEYLLLTQGCEYTVQLGDLGYDLEKIDGKLRIGKDYILFGNHDQYDRENPHYCLKKPYALKDFGILNIPDFPPIFYVRGAWSIDWKWRQRQQEWPQNGPKTWFEEEELSSDELQKAVTLYKKAKPEFVVTHEAPISVVPQVTDPDFVLNFGYDPGVIKTRTSLALQEMFEAHKPTWWLFGHYHFRKEFQVSGTNFICLDMLYKNRSNKNSYIDFDKVVSERKG
jgi:hypothetical protein